MQAKPVRTPGPALASSHALKRPPSILSPVKEQSPLMHDRYMAEFSARLAKILDTPGPDGLAPP